MHISTDEVYGDMAPGAFADENSPLAAQQPLFGLESGFGLAGPLLRSHLRIPRHHHALLQQLRPVPISRKISAA